MSIRLSALFSNTAPLWVSGQTYEVGETVISSATFLEYVRRVAGAGTTDPSLDATNWKRNFGISATKAIHTSMDAAGWNPGQIDSFTANDDTITATSGSLTANTLATAFSRGVACTMPQLTIRKTDTTSNTIRVRVTVDGEVVFDRTSTAATTNNYGICLAGRKNSSSLLVLPPLVATESLLIEWASNNTESGKFRIEYLYQDLK